MLSVWRLVTESANRDISVVVDRSLSHSGQRFHRFVWTQAEYRCFHHSRPEWSHRSHKQQTSGANSPKSAEESTHRRFGPTHRSACWPTARTAANWECRRTRASVLSLSLLVSLRSQLCACCGLTRLCRTARAVHLLSTWASVTTRRPIVSVFGCCRRQWALVSRQVIYDRDQRYVQQRQGLDRALRRSGQGEVSGPSVSVSVSVSNAVYLKVSAVRLRILTTCRRPKGRTDLPLWGNAHSSDTIFVFVDHRSNATQRHSTHQCWRSSIANSWHRPLPSQTPWLSATKTCSPFHVCSLLCSTLCS